MLPSPEYHQHRTQSHFVGGYTLRGDRGIDLSLCIRDGVPGGKMVLPPGGQDVNTKVEISLPKAFAGKITPFAQPAIQHILRWQELNDLYSCVNQPEDEDQIWERILRSLKVIYQVSP